MKEERSYNHVKNMIKVVGRLENQLKGKFPSPYEKDYMKFSIKNYKHLTKYYDILNIIVQELNEELQVFDLDYVGFAFQRIFQVFKLYSSSFLKHTIIFHSRIEESCHIFKEGKGRVRGARMRKSVQRNIR